MTQNDRLEGAVDRRDKLALVVLGICIGVLLTIAMLAVFADGSIYAQTEGITF